MNEMMKKPMRLQKIDLARGVALIGMVIYHFSWDLGFFLYISPDIPISGGLRALARVVAFTFIFISGYSLYLANKDNIRWLAYTRRLIMIILAACLVSIATYIIMPADFVYFGILHEIALASLVGLLFLRLPILFNLIVAVAIFCLPLFFKSDALNQPAFWWLGLSTAPRFSFDLVPFFPWFSAALFGITTGQIFNRFHLTHYLQKGIHPSWLNKILQLMGRHSLIFYLVHQPILLGGLYLIALFVPPSTSVIRQPLENDCVIQCSEQQNLGFCKNYCSCVLDEMQTQNVLLPFSQGKITQDAEIITKTTNACWQKQIDNN